MTDPSSTRIVVLVTSAFTGIGGIETFNRALAHALDVLAPQHGWSIKVLSLLGHERVPEARDYLPSAQCKLRGFSGSRMQFALSALHAARFAEIVIIGHVNLLPLVPMMGGSVKYLVTHGIEVWKELPRLQKVGLSRITRILSVSSYTKREMMRLNGIEEDRFCVFPNTLDPLYRRYQQTKVDRRTLGLPEGLMLLSVSRLVSSECYKNIRAVITCLREVLGRVPEAFYVVVGDGTDRKILRDLAEHNGVGEKVFFTGTIPDELLPSYYEACDLFVLPSIREGFGIVFLEAMHHGKACIGANAGGVPEVVQHGHTGLLVDASGIPRLLPQAILRLLTDEALRKSMGERGKQALESNFSLARFRSRLQEILCPSLVPSTQFQYASRVS